MGFDKLKGIPYYWHPERGSQWERPEDFGTSQDDFSGSLQVDQPELATCYKTQGKLEAQGEPESADLSLPPGWRRAWCETRNRAYYADIETQTAQWSPPDPQPQ